MASQDLFLEQSSNMRGFYGFSLMAATATATDFASQCQNFNIAIPNVQVNVLEFVTNGTNITTLDADPTCNAWSQVVFGGDICRVSLYVPTSDSSGIHMEAWLPSNWNGRFLSAGNGGLAGCIGESSLEYARHHRSDELHQATTT